MKRKIKIYDCEGKRLVKGDFIAHKTNLGSFYPGGYAVGDLVETKSGLYNLLILGSRELISMGKSIETINSKRGIHIRMYKVKK